MMALRITISRIIFHSMYVLGYVRNYSCYENSNDVFPIYIGDDRTDEDAFQVLRNRGQGIGILVSRVPEDTEASYTLKDPVEVEQFLRRLVEWKRLSNQ
ncbi:hypothetical protein PIB30_035034 [Stylosanthes scabra]|uniref:Trehalose-phosphatase n=1 Tax=Stylosanthes scabra TaxID=79078 RepID=A0ABU6WF04_9FABA|nr:hypothetical protein [Stylosanthes scabra]